MLKIQFIGYLGKNPELRTSETGTRFAFFSVGVNQGNKENKKTTWLDVSCSGKLVDVVMQYLKKGSKIYGEGMPFTNLYFNKENKPVSTLRIYADKIEFLSSTDDKNGEDGTYTLPEVKNEPVGSLNANDVPF